MNKGTIVSETQFYTVKQNNPGGVVLTTENGQEITVSKDYASTFLTSADDFSKEVKVNRTELVNKIMGSSNTAVTVNFTKQIDKKDIIKKMNDLYNGGVSSQKVYEAQVKKNINSFVKGEERTLRGYHNANVDDFGRIQFIDMDIERKAGSFDNRRRLVDPRTVNYAIINGTKYTVK